jgi:pimeloyl-ACP methyl ester carboxylesterase
VVPVIPPPPAPPAIPDSGYVDLEGGAGRLWYRIHGSGGDTVVVPLGAYLEDHLAALSSSHTIIFYDPRNRGRSAALADSSAVTFDQDVADVEFLRRHARASRISLIGFSYYAAVAAAYAARYPERVTRLVMLSPIEPSDSLAYEYDPPDRRARLDTTAARELVRMRAAGRDTSDALAYCQAYWRVNAAVFVGNEAKAASVNPKWCEFTSESPAYLAPHMASVVTTLGARRDSTAGVERISVPVLIIHGSGDLVANPEGARAWSRSLPNSRLWMLAGAGHLAFIEETADLVRGIGRFLAGEWPEGAVRVQP